MRGPTPERVWALTAFTEQVDLGRESHYRLTPASMTTALSTGMEQSQITSLLERGSRQPLPAELSGKLLAWSSSYRRTRLRRAVIVSVDDAGDREAMLNALAAQEWTAEALGPQSLVVWLREGPETRQHEEERVAAALQEAGFAPRWTTAPDSVEKHLSVAASDAH